MRNIAWLGCALGIATLGAGCTALVDSTLAGRGTPDAGIGGMDTGTPVDTGPVVDTNPPMGPCSTFPDGTLCTIEGITSRLICLHGACSLSQCGDGFTDGPSRGGAETCDDGNDTGGDGCEIDCTYTCEQDVECTSTEACTTFTCDTSMHVCAPMSATDGDPCTLSGGATGACRGGSCVPGDCGDGNVVAPEQCEDGNTTNGDGCDNDCTYSCEANADCDNGNPCDGTESCDTAQHLCTAGTAVTCTDDGNACTIESCDPSSGTCVTDTRTNDTDGDGHYAMACGGDDCNDSDGTIHPGAPEVCNGGVDDDCDPSTAEGAPTMYYADCDRDTYAEDGAEIASSCGTPTSPPAACATGGWAVRTGDCDDAEPLAHPGQTAWFTTPHGTSYDYDCNGRSEYQYLYSTTVPACTYDILRGCSGAAYYASRPACGRANQLGTCGGLGRTCPRSVSDVTVACH